MEIAIEATLKDVRKLEEQILAILTALKNDELIKEAPLQPIPLSRDLKLEDKSAEPLKKSVKKSQMHSASEVKSKKNEMDSAPVPMDISDLPASNDKFRLIHSSVFLLPVMGTWVFGMTLVNSSEIAQNLPKLYLNMIPAEIDSIDKPCRVFTYSVQAFPLDVKQGSMENRNVGQGIPYHDTIIPIGNAGAANIQPGCQVLLTATFYHPLGFCSAQNEFSLIASVCLNGAQLWSKTINATETQSIVKLDDDMFKIHRVSILKALGRHTEAFKMERLLSQGDKSPHKALEKFLTPLGFDKISNEDVGIDRSVEVFATLESALLWGMSFKSEKCFRNVNVIRCLVSARSEQQMQVFTKIFSNWLRKEGQQERRKGLKGLSVRRITERDEDNHMINTLRSEIETLMELIRLGQKGSLNSASSRMDHKWIKGFMLALAESDSVFMQNNVFEKD